MDPMPNISIEESNKSIALILNDRIEDIYSIPENGGIRQVDVVGWRKSLRAGFENAFGDYYKVQENVSDADLVLTLKRVKLEFSPTSTTGATVSSIETHITFNSQLKSNDGNTVGRLAKTATSKGSITKSTQATDNVESAVESMYELISEDMFDK